MGRTTTCPGYTFVTTTGRYFAVASGAVGSTRLYGTSATTITPGSTSGVSGSSSGSPLRRMPGGSWFRPISSGPRISIPEMVLRIRSRTLSAPLHNGSTRAGGTGTEVLFPSRGRQCHCPFGLGPERTPSTTCSVTEMSNQPADRTAHSLKTDLSSDPVAVRSWFDRVAVDLHDNHATGRPSVLPERTDWLGLSAGSVAAGECHLPLFPSQRRVNDGVGARALLPAFLPERASTENDNTAGR